MHVSVGNESKEGIGPERRDPGSHKRPGPPLVDDHLKVNESSFDDRHFPKESSRIPYR